MLDNIERCWQLLAILPVIETYHRLTSPRLPSCHLLVTKTPDRHLNGAALTAVVAEKVSGWKSVHKHDASSTGCTSVGDPADDAQHVGRCRLMFHARRNFLNRAFHSAICTKRSSSSLICNTCVRVSSSIIRDEPRGCRQLHKNHALWLIPLSKCLNTIFRFVAAENFTQTRILSYFPINFPGIHIAYCLCTISK